MLRLALLILSLVSLCLAETIFDCFKLLPPTDSQRLNQPCNSGLECGHDSLSCIQGKCQKPNAPGVNCIAEGNVYTSGGLPCCLPMINPSNSGEKCKYYDVLGCKDDRRCQKSHGKNFRCCTMHSGGAGRCLEDSFSC